MSLITFLFIMPSAKTKAPEDSEPPELKTTIATDPGEGDESSSGSDEEAPMAHRQ
jgi:hypothetical protein